jgi:hypothetical protein
MYMKVDNSLKKSRVLLTLSAEGQMVAEQLMIPLMGFVIKPYSMDRY